MTEQGFIPLSSQLGIPGTSYRIQLGLINDKWASRLLKGNSIIDSYVYRDDDSGELGIPNQNMIVGWVLRTVAIPNINPHQIMKTTQVLVKQARQKKEQQKVMAPVSETRDVELEKVPENELKRPKVHGWVKEEGMKSTNELEAEKREAFQLRLAAKKEEERLKASAKESTVKTKRQLHSIPKAQEAGPSKFCPSCGKNLDWAFCPYCGKPLLK